MTLTAQPPTATTLPLGDANPSFMIDTTASGSHQVYRELTMNSFESEVPGCKLLVQWGLVEVNGVWKLAITDNGRGMDAPQLPRYLCNIHSSGKQLGVQANHGTGAKVSALAHNSYGVEYISLVDGAPCGHRVWLHRDPSGIYGLKALDNPIDPAFPYVEQVALADLPPLIRKAGHGTQVILHGHSAAEDTGFGPEGQTAPTKWLTTYLNSRFLKVPAGATLSANNERSGANTNIHRKGHGVRGEDVYLIKVAAKRGTAGVNGADIDWWLIDPAKASKLRDEVAHRGHVTIGYAGEAYIRLEGHSSTSALNCFGITAGTTQVVLHVYPTGVGVQPGDDRESLKVNGVAVGDLLDAWGTEFAQNLPKALADHVAACSGVTSNNANWLLSHLAGHISLTQPRNTTNLAGLVAQSKQKQANRSGAAHGQGSRANKGTPASNSTSTKPPKPQPKYQGLTPSDLATTEWRDFTQSDPQLGDVAAKYVPSTNRLICNTAYSGYVNEVRFWAGKFATRRATAQAIASTVESEVRRYAELALQAALLGTKAHVQRGSWTAAQGTLTPEHLTLAMMVGRTTSGDSISRALGARFKKTVK
jgi:hypothetical protein